MVNLQFLGVPCLSPILKKNMGDKKGSLKLENLVDYYQRFGPDILLPNGRKLGGPISHEHAGVQYFENGYYVARLIKRIYNI